MKQIILLNTHSSIVTGLLCASITLPLFAADLKAAPEGEKPKASPGWIVVEENFYYPWAYEPLDWFHDADMQYRQSEEKAAARHLKYAADSARYEYGDDFVTTHDDLTGWTVTERVPNSLDKNLTVIKAELANLGNTLAKDASAK